MIDWLDKHLVPEWRKAWGMASVRLAAAASALITAFSASPDLLLGIIGFMPTDAVTRAFMAVGVGLVAFFGPTLTRLWKQDKTDAE
jgi:membrane protease YdiL (CAAX protease family)